MNTLNILLSYEYATSLVQIDWCDIVFAIEERFLLPQEAIKHAVSELKNNENPKQFVINLACLKNGESIFPYIYELRILFEKNKKQSQEKFLYILLNWIYEHKEMYCDQLEAVEIIYADFNYPEIISNLVRYMPCNHTLFATSELNVEQIYINWRIFLDLQNTKYKKR